MIFETTMTDPQTGATWRFVVNIASVSTHFEGQTSSFEEISRAVDNWRNQSDDIIFFEEITDFMLEGVED